MIANFCGVRTLVVIGVVLAATESLRAQFQACCLPGGACSFTNEFICESLDGTLLGEGTTCTPNPCSGEACCFGSSLCEMLDAADCIFDGGDPQGAGTICPAPACGGAQTQACCFSDGRCANLTTTSCTTNGGTAQGTGTNCNSTNCTVACSCRGDLNNDGRIDGRDVDGFVDCLLGAGQNCLCGDYGGAAGTQVGDIGPFVNALLNGAGC